MSVSSLIVSCLMKTRSALLSNGKKQLLVNSVRYRKPRWLPIAKSKEFYVRKPTPIVPDEQEELYMRYSKYRADVESIRHFLKGQLSQKGLSATEQQKKDDDADFALMEEQVNEWNKQVATIREDRQSQDAKAEEERIKNVMQKMQEDRLQRSLEAEKKLKKNKAAHFIKPEQLDDAIEVMLDSRSDYNYAITKSGEILPGEHPDQDSNQLPSRTKMSDAAS